MFFELEKLWHLGRSIRTTTFVDFYPQLTPECFAPTDMFFELEKLGHLGAFGQPDLSIFIRS